MKAKIKQVVNELLSEAGRQILGKPARKPRRYKYILTLSEPVQTSRLIREMQKTDIYKHLLNVEQMPLSRYWYEGKYKIIHPK